MSELPRSWEELEHHTPTAQQVYESPGSLPAGCRTQVLPQDCTFSAQQVYEPICHFGQYSRPRFHLKVAFLRGAIRKDWIGSTYRSYPVWQTQVQPEGFAPPSMADIGLGKINMVAGQSNMADIRLGKSKMVDKQSNMADTRLSHPRGWPDQPIWWPSLFIRSIYKGGTWGGDGGLRRGCRGVPG